MGGLKRQHSAQPVPEQDGHVRMVLLFTPHVEEDFPLFLLEDRLRRAIHDDKCWAKDLGRQGPSTPPGLRLQLEDGYIRATSANSTTQDDYKITLNGLGQLQLSVSKKCKDKKIATDWLVKIVHCFVDLVDAVFDDSSEFAQPGRISPELREVKDVTLEVEDAHRDVGKPTSGQAQTQDVVGVDFVYMPVLDNGEQLVADIVSELAIYFRAEDGGVGLDREALLRTMRT